MRATFIGFVVTFEGEFSGLGRGGGTYVFEV